MTLKQLSSYGKDFQRKVLYNLMYDKSFLINVRDIIKLEYFNLNAHKWIIHEILKYYDKFHTVITLEALNIEIKRIGDDEESELLKVTIINELRDIVHLPTDDAEFVKSEFSEFCRNQELTKALLSSTELLQDGNYDGIRDVITTALRAGIDKDIGHVYKKDVETRYREDFRPVIPFPWEAINKKCKGGMGPGDLILVFGNPGGGKSWLMVNIAAVAVELGYNVVYYTLELSEDYVGKRFDCYYTGEDIDKVDGSRDRVENIIEKLPGNLVIKEYPPKKASIATIEAHLDHTEEELHDKVDLVIIDYLDYLKPGGKFQEKKDGIDDVYVNAKGMAKERGIPILSPSQVNRSGARDNVIEGDKAAGSYDKMMIADMSFSLSRKTDDKLQGIGRFHMMKNRYGQDGHTFTMDIDTTNGRTAIREEGYVVESPKDTTIPGVNEVARDFLAKKFYELQQEGDD